ncbi:hypothetical protein PR048_012561 [Dryococelus australis]|uniref:Uncharacterized protein n=1 Tax=Dryococelus australis TaxID=614101 RepID=A0ABQ9HPR3_9NEOP|nr:hypothetical protein PR048_012561 [Dryococelus australis]
MRTYKRKTERGKTPPDIMEIAAKLVVETLDLREYSVLKIAKEFDINFSTLSRYIQKLKKRNLCQIREQETPNPASTGYQQPRPRSSQIMFGLTLKEVRKFAYECGVSFRVNVSDSWESNKCAGPDCFTAFKKRNPKFSIR